MIHLLWWVIWWQERLCLKGDIKKHKLSDAPPLVPGHPSSGNRQVEGKGQRGESSADFPDHFQLWENCIALVT